MKAESPTTVEAAAKGLSKIFFSLVVVFLPNQKGLSVRLIKKKSRLINCPVKYCASNYEKNIKKKT